MPETPFPRVRQLADYFDAARFEVTEDWTWGDAGTWRLREQATGRRYILKRCPPGELEAEREVLASRLLPRVLDHPVSEARFALPGRRDVAVVRHAEALPHVGQVLFPARRLLHDYENWDPERVDRLVARLVEPLAPLHNLIADFVTDQTDRHQGNWLVATDVSRSDRWHIVPIDHALSFGSQPPTARLLDPWPGRAAFAELHLSALQQGRTSAGRTRMAFRRMMARWRRAAATTDLTWLELEDPRHIRDTIAARLAHLSDHERKYLDLLSNPEHRAPLRQLALEQLREREERGESFPVPSGPLSLGHVADRSPRAIEPGGGPPPHERSPQPPGRHRGRRSSPRRWRRRSPLGRDGLER
jgi:hypothetical protein